MPKQGYATKINNTRSRKRGMLQRSVHQFLDRDSAGKFRKNIWTEIGGTGTEIGGKRTELSGKWAELSGTPKSAKGCVVSEVDGKNMNGRNFLQNLSGQKFVSMEVPGIILIH